MRRLGSTQSKYDGTNQNIFCSVVNSILSHHSIPVKREKMKCDPRLVAVALRNPAVDMFVDGDGLAKRKRERRLRAFQRYVRWTVAMEATVRHHSNHKSRTSVGVSDWWRCACRAHNDWHHVPLGASCMASPDRIRGLYDEPAPMIEYTTPGLAITYTVPAPVFEYVPDDTYAAPEQWWNAWLLHLMTPTSHQQVLESNKSLGLFLPWTTARRPLSMISRRSSGWGPQTKPGTMSSSRGASADVTLPCRLEVTQFSLPFVFWGQGLSACAVRARILHLLDLPSFRRHPSSRKASRKRSPFRSWVDITSKFENEVRDDDHGHARSENSSCGCKEIAQARMDMQKTQARSGTNRNMVASRCLSNGRATEGGWARSWRCGNRERSKAAWCVRKVWWKKQ